MDGLSNDVTHLVKFVLLGDNGAGKTSIMHRLMDNTFDKNIAPSLGSEFYSQNFTCSRAFKVQFWDTAGGERFYNNRQIFYLDASIFFIVFDICNEDALMNIPKHLEEIRWKKDEGLDRYATEFKNGAIVCLVGNKRDMRHLRKVSEDDARMFAKTHDLHYFEMSAKTGEDVKSIFEEVILAFDEMDAKDRKAGGVGLSKVLDFAPSSVDFEESEPLWIEYDGRKNKYCCC